TRFSTKELEPGQYIVNAYVTVVTKDELFANGTRNLEAIQSSVASHSFQVLTDQDINNRIIALATIAGSIITGIAIWTQIRISKSRIGHENQKRWKDLYDAHSKLLAEVIANRWNYFSGIFASYRLEDYRFVNSGPKEPDVEHAREARDHLIKGYPDTWTMYEKALAESISIVDRMQSISAKAKANVSRAVQRAIPDLAKETSWKNDSKRFYDIEAMTSTILTDIRSSKFHGSAVTKSTLGKLDMHIGHILTELNIFSYHIARGEENDMVMLKEIVDQLLTDPEMVRLACEYSDLEKELSESQNMNEYSRGIEHLISDIRAGLPIRGKRSCRICKELYDSIFKDSKE
ncbi:MAG: hypothetical protein ACREBU_22420, partial [Nitrososphaera sp.]